MIFMMYIVKKFITIFLVASFLVGCSGNGFFVLKRSANNKIFDTKGFHGQKRAPLYNKKYIKQAKKNVVNSVYDEDDMEEDEVDPELRNPAQDNIYMYKAMAENDRNFKKRANARYNGLEEEYPRLADSKARYHDPSSNQNQELQKELKQIKALLEDARNSLNNTKCPSASSLESRYNKQQQERAAKKGGAKDGAPVRNVTAL